MKKILILTVVFTLLIASNGFAQMKIGVFGGYNLWLADFDAGATGTKGGVSFGAKLGYGLSDSLSIGLITGYLSLYNSEWAADYGASGKVASETSMSDIPIIAFGQLNFGGVYVLGGLGLHLTSTTTEVTGTGLALAMLGGAGSTTVSGSSIGATIGAGYEIDLGGAGLEVGGLFHLFSGSKMVTIHAGVNFGI